MHRLFSIADIVAEVAQYLSSRRDQYHFALVSRLIWSTCFSLLWRVADLHSLRLTLPDGAVKMDDGAAPLVRPITAGERATFERYTARIQELTLDDEYCSVHHECCRDMQYCLAISNVLHQAYNLRLFPALRTLFITVGDKSGMRHLVPVLGILDLSELGLVLTDAYLKVNQSVFIVTRLLDAIPASSGLRSLLFSHVHAGLGTGHVNLQRPLTNLLTRLTGLRTLQIGCAVQVDEAVVDAIGRLPHLTYLQLPLDTAQVAHHEDRFPALQALQCIFRNMSAPHVVLHTMPMRLQRIQLICLYEDLAALGDVLSDRFGNSLKQLDLMVIVGPMDSPPTPHALRSLAGCTELTSVKLKVNAILAILIPNSDVITLSKRLTKLEFFSLAYDRPSPLNNLNYKTLVAFSFWCPALHTLALPAHFCGTIPLKTFRRTKSRLKELHLLPGSCTPSAKDTAFVIKRIFPRLLTLYCFTDERDNIRAKLPGIRSEMCLQWWHEEYPNAPLPPIGSTVTRTNLERPTMRDCFAPRWLEEIEPEDAVWWTEEEEEEDEEGEDEDDYLEGSEYDASDNE